MKWFGQSSPFDEAIKRGLKEGADLSEELRELRDTPVRTRADGVAICKGFEKIYRSPEKYPGALGELAGLFAQVESPQAPAVSVLLHRGVPLVIKLVDEAIQGRKAAGISDVLEAVKHLLSIGVPYATTLVVKAARAGFGKDDPMWLLVFREFGKDDAASLSLFSEFDGELPDGLIASSLLEVANQYFLKGEEGRHPFDSDCGVKKLEAWLMASDAEDLGDAVNSTVALPFLTHSNRDDLLVTAMRSSFVDVQIEAAWAAAKLDHPLGAEKLCALCLDVGYSKQAQKYLAELGLELLIPATADAPDFQAKAEFASWLAHPNELGKLPDEVEILDHRVLKWPPNFEPTPVWLIRYRVKADSELEPDEEGVGMVGGITWCFFSSDLLQRPPEDAYAFHCFWELQQNDLGSEDAVSSSEYDSLIDQWGGEPLCDIALMRVAEISPSLGYAGRLVGIASACRVSELGWLILDGADSVWLPVADFPNGDSPGQILKIHIGRKLLGLTHEVNRRSFLQEPKTKPPEEIVRAYEKLLLQVENMASKEKVDFLKRGAVLDKFFDAYINALVVTKGGRKADYVTTLYMRLWAVVRSAPMTPKEAYDCFSLLGGHFEAQVNALCELEQPRLARELIETFEPFFQHNLGYSKLALAAAKAGDDGLAELFFIKFQNGIAEWRKHGDTMSKFAELLFRKGKLGESKGILFGCLRFQQEDAKDAWVQDRPLLEKQYAEVRDTFCRLFAAEDLKQEGIPERLF